jgi:hypothetical protein
MSTKDMTIPETRTTRRIHIRDDSDLKTYKSCVLLLQIIIQRTRLDLSYRWQRKGHFELLHRGTYDETIVGKGT